MLINSEIGYVGFNNFQLWTLLEPYDKVSCFFIFDRSLILYYKNKKYMVLLFNYYDTEVDVDDEPSVNFDMSSPFEVI
eukprot:Pgem_evm1s15082